MITGNGGLLAYTGSTDMQELMRRAATDAKVREVIDAFHYRVAKEIGAMAAAMKGQVDQIILTGGIAHGQETVDALKGYVSWIAPVTVYPGEGELLALAEGALRVLRGEETLAHSESVGGDYTEGNAWQYTWHVQHDVPGLIQLFGGEKPFLNKLDSLFTVKLEGESLADVTGLIGQYAHGNEPSHHVTYLYALAGRPERTQELVREIFDTQYKNKPDGLCGNDDCGQMSAWYMLSAMGFYPVDPVSAEYVFGAPQLPKMTLHLADGKTFTIIAENLSKEHKYVDSITLNGEPYTKKTISHEDIVKGGILVYKMK